MLSSFVEIPSCSLYAVDKNGRVMRIVSNRCGARAGKILKPQRGGNGYFSVGLSLGAAGVKQRTVHSLVAETFIGPRPDGLDINHKNGIKLDNHYRNLEYVTQSGNAKHAAQRGLTSFPVVIGEKVWNSKLNADKVRDIRSSNLSLRALARKYGVNKSAIQGVKHRRTWGHIK